MKCTKFAEDGSFPQAGLIYFFRVHGHEEKCSDLQNPHFFFNSHLVKEPTALPDEQMT